MAKVVTIVGARPQFIKAAVVSRAIAESGALREIMIHTGQHYDRSMSDVFYQELQMKQPEYSLGIGSGSHGKQTGRMLESIEEVLLKESPDMVLVYGDTNSTVAGALAAAKLHIPVAHVEAGLRSYNRRMPEEINRVVTDHLSTLLFAPTEEAAANLAKEGIAPEKVITVGDVMYDAVLVFGEIADSTSSILDRLGLESKGYVLATIHRAENTDERARLESIIDGLRRVADQVPVVLPLHPRTAKSLESHGVSTGGIQVIEPVGYLDMLVLEKHARLIATDSGGVQKEAFFHGVSCVTLREETEWVELVALGWNHVVPPGDALEIERAILSALDQKGKSARPYGDGDAAQRIVGAIAANLDQGGHRSDIE